MTAQQEWLIQEARVVDPFRGMDAVTTVGIRNGIVVPVADLTAPTVIDARGLWLVPAMTDLHVHFRDPGQEWKETILSGSRAAAAGGVTRVGIMPNTVPVTDSPAAVIQTREKVRQLGLVEPWVFAAVTQGSGGHQATDWPALKDSGARALSDDGRPVSDSGILRAALKFSEGSGVPVIQHLEDLGLSSGGAAHAGQEALRWGITGVSEAAEAVMAWRDVALVGYTGGSLHLAHCSTPGTLEALAWARSRGLQVTGEASPHHLLLTDEALSEWRGHAVTKVNPPLRPSAMRDALRKAVVSGLVSVIASDHAPHAAAEKALPYAEAPFGISGLETLVGVVLTVLLHGERMSPLAVMATLTTGPHAVVRQNYGGVVAGAMADLTLLDPATRWRVDTGEFYSRGHNTPLEGAWLQGRPVLTMKAGQITCREGEVLA